MKKFYVRYCEDLQYKEMIIEAYGRMDAQRRIKEMQKERNFTVIQLCELKVIEEQREMLKEIKE